MQAAKSHVFRARLVLWINFKAVLKAAHSCEDEFCLLGQGDLLKISLAIFQSLTHLKLSSLASSGVVWEDNCFFSS